MLESSGVPLFCGTLQKQPSSGGTWRFFTKLAQNRDLEDLVGSERDGELRATQNASPDVSVTRPLCRVTRERGAHMISLRVTR